jgi:hypothetical protein
MRRLLLASTLALLAGCSPIRSVVDTVTGVHVNDRMARDVRELKGVGVDYNWPLVDPWDLAKTLSDSKCTATSIEFMGWDGCQKNGYENGAGSLEKPYKELLKACRHYNVVVFVSILNDNKGSGKYHDNRRPLSAYAAECERAARIVMENGSDGVWVQVVSETQTSYGRSFEARWVPLFNDAGFVTVCNDGARTSRPKHGESLSAWHTCNAGNPGPSGPILIPDCGTAISAYTKGGIYGSELDPNACADFIAKGGHIIYSFTGVTTIPVGAIKAVGKAR